MVVTFGGVQVSLPGLLVVAVWNELCCDGVGGDGRSPLSRGLRREAPPRSENCAGVSVVVLAAAGALRFPRHQLVLCFPEEVENGMWVAPPRTLVSLDVGVFGASSAWLFGWGL